MSEDSTKRIELEFRTRVRYLKFQLEEDYNTFYQKYPDSDRIDFCVKILGIVPTHKEAGRYIVPSYSKYLMLLITVNSALFFLMREITVKPTCCYRQNFVGLF